MAFLQGSCESTDLITHQKVNHRHHILPGEVGTLAKGLTKKYQRRHNRLFGAAEVKTKGHLYSIYAKQGTVATLSGNDKPLLMVSNNYTAVSKSNPDKFETGSLVQDLQLSVLNMTYPPKPRWSEDWKISSVPFPATAMVTGLGPLSEGISGKVRWSEHSVIGEAEEVIALTRKDSPKDLENHLLRHRQKAAAAANRAWKIVKEMEEEAFGDKSWVRYTELREKDEAPKIPDADPPINRAALHKYLSEDDSRMPEALRRKYWTPALSRSLAEPSEDKADSDTESVASPYDESSEESDDEPANPVHKPVSRVELEDEVPENRMDEDEDEGIEPPSGTKTRSDFGREPDNNDDNDSLFSETFPTVIWEDRPESETREDPAGEGNEENDEIPTEPTHETVSQVDQHYIPAPPTPLHVPYQEDSTEDLDVQIAQAQETARQESIANATQLEQSTPGTTIAQEVTSRSSTKQGKVRKPPTISPLSDETPVTPDNINPLRLGLQGEGSGATEPGTGSSGMTQTSYTSPLAGRQRSRRNRGKVNYNEKELSDQQFGGSSGPVEKGPPRKKQKRGPSS